MRLGLGGRRATPQQLAGYGVMGLGGLIMLFSLPLNFWMAAAGGFLCYLGNSVRCHR